MLSHTYLHIGTLAVAGRLLMQQISAVAEKPRGLGYRITATCCKRRRVLSVVKFATVEKMATLLAVEVSCRKKENLPSSESGTSVHGKYPCFGDNRISLQTEGTYPLCRKPIRSFKSFQYNSGVWRTDIRRSGLPSYHITNAN